ncbi:hypothetical protein OH77DRAFT_1001735 [Trametes cingulata]|nr:hypothetical protein OH77DRAFT_1001735 [Trametes cingulata]
MNAELLDDDKPTEYENDFEKVEVDTEGILVLHNKRFTTKVRKSDRTFIVINGGELHTTTVDAIGRETTLRISTGQLPTEFKKVHVYGREEPTCAESKRDEFVMRLLQDRASLDRSLFVRLVWLPERNHDVFRRPNSREPAGEEEFSLLNAAQRGVAAAMTARDEPLVIVHGPPGTGKTRTIAAALTYWQAEGQPVWVVTESNVGVKNIARSILESGLSAFKLIVSFNFHYEWHEHLYEGGLGNTLIVSNEFSSGRFDAKHRIGDAKIILCKLSMLSNPSLKSQGVFQYLPVERLVVDEASQIHMFEFMVRPAAACARA